MTTHRAVNTPYCCSQIQGTPLLPHLATLQNNGHKTLADYLDYCFTQDNPLPVPFILPVIDTYLYSMQMTVTSIGGEGLTGFWQTPFCNQHCEKEEQVHACTTSDGSSVDCDMFCAGDSEDNSDDDTGSRNLNRYSLSCTKNRRGELTSCGIQDIVLHYQKKPTGNTIVSIELAVGCSSESRSTFVIQSHFGLIFSLK